MLSLEGADDQTRFVHYEGIGKANRPVVFIHDWFGTWRYWWPVMSALTSYSRSYAVSLWGFGSSSKFAYQEMYSISSQMQLVVDFIERLRIRNCVLVGHGLGAVVALAVANYFSKIEAAANADATLFEAQVPKDEVIVESLVCCSFPLGVEIDIDEKKYMRTLQTFSARHAPHVVFGKNDWKAVEISMQEVQQMNLESMLVENSKPIVLIEGAKDRWGSSLVPKTKYSNSQSLLFPESGRFVMLKDLTNFSRVINTVLQQADVQKIQRKSFWQRRIR